MDIDEILTTNKEDTYSSMLLLLYASSDNPRYSILSELPYILDHDNFVKFIKYYEGQTITIPPLKESIDSLRVLMLFQYSKVEGLPWQDALKKAGFSKADSFSAKHKLDRFCSQLNRFNYRLGGLLKGRKDDEPESSNN